MNPDSNSQINDLDLVLTVLNLEKKSTFRRAKGLVSRTHSAWPLHPIVIGCQLQILMIHPFERKHTTTIVIITVTIRI